MTEAPGTILYLAYAPPGVWSSGPTVFNPALHREDLVQTWRDMGYDLVKVEVKDEEKNDVA